jgi:plasmid stabilization system protein ParE
MLSDAMSYSLQITAKALRAIDEALQWWAKRSVRSAIRWYVNLMDAVPSLPDDAEQWGLAPESEWYPGLRQRIVGNKRSAYRILFEIRGEVVYILRVRHGAQDLLGAEEL